MFDRRTTQEFLKHADQAYASGDLQLAEQLLANVARFRSIGPIEREEIFAKLSGMASLQGQYLAAVNWYAHVLQSKSRRLDLRDPEMQRSLHNYRVLLEMAQPQEEDTEESLNTSLIA